MKTKRKSFTSRSSDETLRAARDFGRNLKPGQVVALYGDLGSGKTTFIRGIAEGLGLARPKTVKSPTFVLMHIYPARVPVYHFDLYRLREGRELDTIGLDDFLNDPRAVSCVEWAERARAQLPAGLTHEVFLKITGPSSRRITIRSPGGRASGRKTMYS